MSQAKSFKAILVSPIGLLEVEGTKRGLVGLRFLDNRPRREYRKQKDSLFLQKCINQLDEYFKGRRKKFCLKLDLRGTDFQMKVWAELLNVPFGETASYQNIARAVGHERATRAVGGANHKNPLPIIVPCHRIVGKNGQLTGYGGGIWRKEWLIEHEKSCS